MFKNVEHSGAGGGSIPQAGAISGRWEFLDLAKAAPEDVVRQRLAEALRDWPSQESVRELVQVLMDRAVEPGKAVPGAARALLRSALPYLHAEKNYCLVLDLLKVAGTPTEIRLYGHFLLSINYDHHAYSAFRKADFQAGMFAAAKAGGEVQ